MTQNKARRTNKMDFLQLPVTQEVAVSSPVARAITYTSESMRHSLNIGYDDAWTSSRRLRVGSDLIDFPAFSWATRRS
jgi:hypothetical protein